MKIAGLKNDGAWFRANKAIHNLTEAEKASLVTYLDDATADWKDAAFTSIQSIASTTGATMPDSPNSSSAWISRLVFNGIPRQVYMGRLSFTVYDKVLDGGNAKYIPRGQSEMQYFGKSLRKALSQWLHGRRMVNDLTDTGLATQGNPGGQPDSVAGN